MIYRCGYCGMPVDFNGMPLSKKELFKAEKKILEGVEFIHVNGACCPQGNEHAMVQVTYDMAIDAGMPELEGQWVNW